MIGTDNQDNPIGVLCFRVGKCEEDIVLLKSSCYALDKQSNAIDKRLTQVEVKIDGIEKLLRDEIDMIKIIHDKVDTFIEKHRLDAWKIFVELFSIGTIITLLQIFLK